MTVAWVNGQCCDITTEGAARDGEAAPMPEGATEMFTEWQSVMKVDRYLDINDPWLMTAPTR